MVLINRIFFFTNITKISTPEYHYNLTGPTGVIKTPNHPSPYPNLAECRWSIKVDEGSSIRLIFASFQSENQHDFVYVKYLIRFIRAECSGTFHCQLNKQWDARTICFRSEEKLCWTRCCLLVVLRFLPNPVPFY